LHLPGKSEIEFSVVLGDAWVFGPHPEQHLADGAEDVRNCSSCDRFTAGGNVSLVVTMAEQSEERDGVIVVPEERVNAGFSAKRVPDFPVGILGVGSLWCDAIGDVLLNSEVLSLEDISEFRWQTSQDFVCG